jgi:hypothetical protein
LHRSKALLRGGSAFLHASDAGRTGHVIQKLLLRFRIVDLFDLFIVVEAARQLKSWAPRYSSHGKHALPK